MSKKRPSLDWTIKARVEDFKSTLIRIRKYLVDKEKDRQRAQPMHSATS